MLRSTLTAVGFAATAVLAVPAGTALAATTTAVTHPAPHGPTAAQRAEHARQLWLAQWRNRLAQDRLARARAARAAYVAAHHPQVGARWVAIQREYLAAQTACTGTQRQVVLLQVWR